MFVCLFYRISSQLVNSESTYSKLLEFEAERERLIKLKEEAALSAAAAHSADANNASNTSTKRQYFRKKVGGVLP